MKTDPRKQLYVRSDKEEEEWWRVFGTESPFKLIPTHKEVSFVVEIKFIRLGFLS